MTLPAAVQGLLWWVASWRLDTDGSPVDCRHWDCPFRFINNKTKKSTLAPDDLVGACAFRDRSGKCSKPVWRDPPGDHRYAPCYNIAPTAHTPVLLSSGHYRGELDSIAERVVQPMKWGLVPRWHKGDPYKLPYETNNCRAEGMLSKPTYKAPLEMGRRCVVLADGFFEWKRGQEGKQPYFIYFPQASSSSSPPADAKPEPRRHTDNEPRPHGDSSAKPPLKQESADTKPDPLEPGLKSSVDSRVKQDPVDLKPSTCAGIKPEPVDVKPDGDAKPSTSAGIKPEPVDVEPDADAKSSTSAGIKQEPVDVEPDADAKPSTSAGIKLEPMDIKPDADAVLKGVRQEEGDAVCSSSAERGSATSEWHGKRLLTMAGVFDVWQPPDGSSPLYSYSVITVEASPTMAEIHHRMPAILSTEEEVSAWLDFAHTPLTQAVKVIRPTETVSMHMVSPVVNNSRNKSPECVQVYDPKQVKRSGSSNLMMNWLKKAAPSAQSNPPPSKKQKLA